jgi:hypothetical protein
MPPSSAAQPVTFRIVATASFFVEEIAVATWATAFCPGVFHYPSLEVSSEESDLIMRLLGNTDTDAVMKELANVFASIENGEEPAGKIVQIKTKAALEHWQHFRLGWVEACPDDTPIKEGQVVAMLAASLPS